MSDVLTWDDVPVFIDRAARAVASRYSHWGVGYDDASQYIWEWVLQRQRKVEKWLESDPPRPTRVYFALVDAGATFGEREKAARLGYDTDDLSWYSPNMVVGLMPIVLEDDYDGLHGETDNPGGTGGLASEGQDLLARVMDIRRAIYRLPDWVGEVLRQKQPGDPNYDDAVQHVVDYLGGNRRIGKRKIRSNAWAQAETRD